MEFPSAHYQCIPWCQQNSMLPISVISKCQSAIFISVLILLICTQSYANISDVERELLSERILLHQ